MLLRPAIIGFLVTDCLGNLHAKHEHFDFNSPVELVPVKEYIYIVPAAIVFFCMWRLALLCKK